MQIKTDDTFLAIERVRKNGATAVWELQTAVTGTTCVVATCRQARVRADGEVRKRVSDFAAQRARRLELLLPRVGWLRLRRGLSGQTVVRYRVGGLSGGSSVEGELRLEGKATQACCHELRKLL
jgi:hypothetical protein